MGYQPVWEGVRPSGDAEAAGPLLVVSLLYAAPWATSAIVASLAGR